LRGHGIPLPEPACPHNREKVPFSIEMLAISWMKITNFLVCGLLTLYFAGWGWIALLAFRLLGNRQLGEPL